MQRLRIDQNGFPQLYYPFALKKEQLQDLFQQALATGKLLSFTLEKIQGNDAHLIDTEPVFLIKFGHFGFQIETHRSQRKNALPIEWQPRGRLIDLDQFCKGWEGLSGSWMLNALSFSPLQAQKYKPVPKPKLWNTNPSGAHTYTQVARITHRFGFDEVLPYHQENGQHYVGRWYQAEGAASWSLEWFALPETMVPQITQDLVLPAHHMPVYPLEDQNELVSDFLNASALYLPPNYVPCLSPEQKRQQLLDSIWWMETRFRVLPRYPFARLKHHINLLSLEADLFTFPSAQIKLPPMTTTEILQTYAQRGNVLLRWLMSISSNDNPQQKEKTMSTNDNTPKTAAEHHQYYVYGTSEEEWIPGTYRQPWFWSSPEDLPVSRNFHSYWEKLPSEERISEACLDHFKQHATPITKDEYDHLLKRKKERQHEDDDAEYRWYGPRFDDDD